MSIESRVERFDKARGRMKDLMAAPQPHKFAQDCESIFQEFRTSCVHLRKEREALDKIEDKEVCWNFICRFSKEVPFQHKRCEEVLRILLTSDAWMDALANDPDADISALPPDIADELKKRLDEVKNPDDPTKPAPQEKEARAKQVQPQSVGARGVCMVVQHCISAEVAADDKGSKACNIGPGIVIHVNFGEEASEDGIRGAARFLLKCKLTGTDRWLPNGSAGYGSGAESIVDVCKRGEQQGILVILQGSLAAELAPDGIELQYVGSRLVKPDRLFDQFIEALRSTAEELIREAKSGTPVMPVIVACNFGGREFASIRSAGAFMHTFCF